MSLLNKDCDELLAGKQHEVASAANLLFDRIDVAREKSQRHAVLGEVPYRIRMKVAAALEDECRKDLDARNRQAPQGTKGRTFAIEAARGAPNGAALLWPRLKL